MPDEGSQSQMVLSNRAFRSDIDNPDESKWLWTQFADPVFVALSETRLKTTQKLNVRSCFGVSVFGLGLRCTSFTSTIKNSSLLITFNYCRKSTACLVRLTSTAALWGGVKVAGGPAGGTVAVCSLLSSCWHCWLSQQLGWSTFSLMYGRHGPRTGFDRVSAAATSTFLKLELPISWFLSGCGAEYGEKTSFRARFTFSSTTYLTHFKYKYESWSLGFITARVQVQHFMTFPF